MQKLPNAALYIIAEHLAKLTSFRDKVDVAIDAAAIAMACLPNLAREIVYLIDPISTNGKLTFNVLENIKRKKNKWIPAKNATHSWGLSTKDLDILPTKLIFNIVTYKLQDVKRLSEQKYHGDDMNLYSVKQSQRTSALKNALSQPIRPDSKYCEFYIKTGKGNLEDIARLLREMDFYHMYTCYPRLYSMYSQKYISEYGYYDRDDISSDAKTAALKRFKKQYPDKLHLVPQTLLRFL